MCYDEYLTCLAKTDPPLTLFEHSSDVLQVVNYLIEQNIDGVKAADTVRAAALTHDVGKIKQDRQAGKWIHSPYSSSYLRALLNEPRFQGLLTQAGVDMNGLDYELLLSICEEHHNPSPKLLRSCKDAILVSVADALASSINVGMVGSITEILRSNPYTQVSLELVKALGFDKGFNGEFHRIVLPGQFTEDLFLADIIFQIICEPLRQAGVTPLVQKGASLWVVGFKSKIRSVLVDFMITPEQLYSVFDQGIYDSILAGLPSPGSIQIDSLKYILVNENIACKLAIALYTRKSVRTLFEKYNLSHLIDKADEFFQGGLVRGIEGLWREVAAKVNKMEPKLILSESVTDQIQTVVEGKVDRGSIGLISPNKKVLEKVQAGDKKKSEDIQDFLKLFDASGNYYRSLTNILLEMLKMKADTAKGVYNLDLKEVTVLDGRPLTNIKSIKNSALCPVCRKNPQEITATGLITGNPKTDSVYQTFRGTRSQIKVCKWCFLTGYVDLPIATIRKDGQSISKEREYLLLTSPLPRETLQKLVDFAQRERNETTDELSGEGGETEQERPEDSGLMELQEILGMASGYDELAVLGASRRRLSNLKGFTLPTMNVLGSFVGIRMPLERLVGEDKVSGGVSRELVKAAMYDLHLATGAPSMHYNVVTSDAFSVEGRPLDICEMRRASTAYRVADRYARFGRYRQLNSGLFMLLLSNPRQAITTILRTQRRENRGQYAPGEERIKELIEMVENLARDDWKFTLGLRIVGTLVEVDLLPKARGFRKGPGPRDVFSGVDLVKWIQRIKMVKDESSARAWGTTLINALKRGDVASKEYILQKGGQILPPGEATVRKIVDLVEEIIQTCADHKCKLSEFSRVIAEMDYYLLFYHNQKAKEASKNE